MVKKLNGIALKAKTPQKMVEMEKMEKGANHLVCLVL